MKLDATLKEKLQQEHLGLGGQALQQRGDLPQELGSPGGRQDSDAAEADASLWSSWCLGLQRCSNGNVEMDQAAQSTAMRHSSLVPHTAVLLKLPG